MSASVWKAPEKYIVFKDLIETILEGQYLIHCHLHPTYF